MKSEWEIGYIESSYSRRLRTFPSAVAEPRQTYEMFDFRFTFLRRKRAFFMHVLKKSILENAVKKTRFGERREQKNRSLDRCG